MIVLPHMAGTCAPATWSTHRDIAAARVSWERARQIADALPADHPGRTAMRIAPRTMLCGAGWRVDAHIAGHFEELRELCALAGDKASLAIGMAGMVMDHMMHGRVREASRLASEQMALLESIGDPALTVGAGSMAILIKYRTGEIADVLRWSQTVIDWADGDPTKGNLIVGSPLAVALVWRGVARFWLGRDGWRQDLDDAICDGPEQRPGNPRPGRLLEARLGDYATGCSSPTTPRCANSTTRCRSPNDRATIPRSALPGTSWVSRCCLGTAQRTISADWSCWRRSATCACTGGSTKANYRASRLLTHSRGPGAATAMVPYR